MRVQYGYAACLLQLEYDAANDEKEENIRMSEVVEVMDSIPGLMRRIARKSLPMEVGS